MKLPAKVRIAGYDCKITRTKLEYDENGEDAWGSFDTDKYEIELADSDDDFLVASTLVHEIEHAINHIYGLPDDEAVVRKRETALVQLLRDNKTLFRTLLKVFK